MNQKTSRGPFRSMLGSVAFSVLCAACQHPAPESSSAPIRNVAARGEIGPTQAARTEAGPEPSKKAKDVAADEREALLPVAPATRAAPVGKWVTESAVVAGEPLSASAAPAPPEARRADFAGPTSAVVGGSGAPMARKGRSRAALAAPADDDQEAYAASTDTSFALVKDSPLSTFSIDVDTASYANVRRFLAQGQLPPPGAVRIEELINYFPYAYPDPIGNTPVSVTTELSVAPWNTAHRLLHVGVQGRRMSVSELPARNLVFLIDVSGSMASPNKLPLLKRSLATLTGTLGERDQVAMVVYAGASGVVLPPTSGNHKAEIMAALDRLAAGGSTNGGEGIELAYSLASGLARPGASTRVILATDGDFNVGATSEDALVRLITERRKTGVFLSVLGFGMGNYKDATLEQLADQGNGNYAYVDSLAEARKVLVAEGGSTLVTLAQDVKLQLEFNPQTVGSYRLIGYENRRLEARDFNDDRKDAGELGAGHGVTALYELIPPALVTATNGVDPTRYQSAPLPTPGHGGELCTVKLRYQEPGGGRSQKIEHVVRDTDTALSATSAAFRFSAAVATFGMTLRGSPDRGKGSFELARELARGAMGTDVDGYQREFIGLVDRAAQLAGGPIATGPLVMP